MSCCAKLWLSPLASAPRQSLSMPQYIRRLWAITPGRVNNRKLYQRGWALENVKLEYDPGYVFLDVFSYCIDQTTKRSKMYFFSAHWTTRAGPCPGMRSTWWLFTTRSQCSVTPRWPNTLLSVSSKGKQPRVEFPVDLTPGHHSSLYQIQTYKQEISVFLHIEH